MPRVPGERDTPRLPEPLTLAAPQRDAIITATGAALTAAAFALAADHRALSHIQHLDDSWLQLMISGRDRPTTVIAGVFNVLGPVYVTLPVRIAIAGHLAFRRLWRHLAAFAGAVLLSEVLIGPLKAVYGQPRPPWLPGRHQRSVFPPGHSIAASVTVLAAVIVLVPPGRRRVAWGLAAGVFAVPMAASRAYLGARWLSDAIAGLLLGTTCALVAAVAADRAQRGWRTRHTQQAGGALPEAVYPTDRR